MTQKIGLERGVGTEVGGDHGARRLAHALGQRLAVDIEDALKLPPGLLGLGVVASRFDQGTRRNGRAGQSGDGEVGALTPAELTDPPAGVGDRGERQGHDRHRAIRGGELLPHFAQQQDLGLQALGHRGADVRRALIDRKGQRGIGRAAQVGDLRPVGDQRRLCGLDLRGRQSGQQGRNTIEFSVRALPLLQQQVREGRSERVGQAQADLGQAALEGHFDGALVQGDQHASDGTETLGALHRAIVLHQRDQREPAEGKEKPDQNQSDRRNGVEFE